MNFKRWIIKRFYINCMKIVFLIKKFSKLLTKCNNLTKEYCEFGKSNNYNEVVKSIFAIFQYTFFALFNHFAENDIFIISNYGKDLTPRDVSKYYFQISEITKKIIL